MHAKLWIEKYPGSWNAEEDELAVDPDDFRVGTPLCEAFAQIALDRHRDKLPDGTHFRISRSNCLMQDFVVRAGLVFGLKRITPRAYPAAP
jgi:hypothetical protein